MLKHKAIGALSVPPNGKLIYSLLLDNIDEKGELQIPIRVIAKSLGISKRATGNNLHCLEESGFIQLFRSIIQMAEEQQTNTLSNKEELKMNLNCLLKNRTIIGGACIGLSLIICFGLTPLFNRGFNAQTEIVRVTKDIVKGDVISTDKIERVKVGGYNLPSTVAKNMDQVKGKYATADMFKGDYILTAKLTEQPFEQNEYLYRLDGTKEAISVSIKSFALGLSGKLKSGDIVSIIASDYGEMRQTLIPPELQYVEVLAVTTAKGLDENLQAKEDKSNDEKQLPATVTLLVNTVQATILADLEAKSKIHIALVYRGNAETANQFLNAQDETIKMAGGQSNAQ